MTSLVPTRPRARVLALAGLAGLLLVVLSPLFGRADVGGSYRPLLPADGLTNGCYPLPGDVRLDFPYVLRRDSQIVAAEGLRREVVLHFDRIDAAEAIARTEETFRAAGVLDQVDIRARDFEGNDDDAVIRGEMLLRLPVTSVRPTGVDCLNLWSTKRITPDLPDRS